MLFTLCAANELFFMGMYLDYFQIGWTGACMQQDPISACAHHATTAVSVFGGEITAWLLVCYLCFPLFVAKHIVG